MTGEQGLRVTVDTDGGIAPWRQIYDQLARMIARTTLPAGSRLPPIRQLAGDLGLASGTVARAYRELEAAGLVVTARAKGTVVAESDPRAGADALLASGAVEFAELARELGADRAAAVEAVRAAYGRVTEGAGEAGQ